MSTLHAAVVSFVAGLAMVSAPAAAQSNSCWGQATAVFAAMGVMGEHASAQSQPRVGLARLARSLYEVGVIPEPTLAALGAYVASVEGLEIDRCTSNAVAIVEAEAAVAADAACWGQASAVFAQMGVLGEHSSQQPSPRLGLRNLARALADVGVIPDDSMASLGAFVAADLGLSVDACP